MADAEAGMLVIKRAGGYADGGRAYRVIVDDAELSRIRKNQSLRIPLPAGSHRVELRIDWTGSRPVKVQVEPRQEVVLVVTRLGNLFSREGYLLLSPES